MIFLIGLIAFLIGLFLMNVFGTGYRYSHNAADYIGACAFLGGGTAMLVSLGILASHFLP